MNVHCFYHRADLDGHCSAAIVRKSCKENGHSFIPHGVNYGDPIDWSAGAAGPQESMAVVVDFTPEQAPLSTLIMMQQMHSGGVVWIDHHKTAIEAVGTDERNIPGKRRIGTAACVLTWEYFFSGTPCPSAVRHLGKYDVFDRADKQQWEEVTLPLQYGLRMRETNPNGTDQPDLWRSILENEAGIFADLVLAGDTCLAYERKNNRIAAKAHAYDCTFEGLPCCAINARGNSLVLDAYARPEHKMRILWAFDGKARAWRISLYENGHDDVDCGALAKLYGGGGHKGAAGFMIATGARPPLDIFGMGDAEK